MKKLITIDKARPALQQHKKPCSDCPFRRDALPGWLGGDTPEYYTRLAQSDLLIHCHTKLGPQCAGAAIYRANIGKVPRDRKVLRLLPDKMTVFSWPTEFINHHSKKVV